MERLIPATPSLQGLPPELIRLIAAWLPRSSVAALSVTSRRLLDNLGNNIWFELRDDSDVCEAYLFALVMARERLQAGAESNALESPRIHQYFSQACLLAGTSLHLWSVFGYAIGWLHVLLAYKQYPTGGSRNVPLDEYAHHTYKTLSLLWNCHCCGNSSKGKSRHVKLIVTPRIVAGYLLLKCEYTVLFTVDDGVLEYRDLLGLRFGICSHVLLDRHLRPGQDSGLAEALVKVNDYRGAPASDDECHHGELEPTYDDILGPGPERARCHVLRQCMYCATEYEVHKHQEADMSGSIVLTAWTNLGTVKSPSSSSFRENNRLWSAFASDPLSHVPEVLFYPRGSVKSAFESWDGSRLSDVGTQNKS